MRSGTAVVMADLPALAEIVENGKTGCLYPAGDAQALAAKISDLLGDKSKRDCLGQNAKNWILEFEPGRQSSQKSLTNTMKGHRRSL